MMEVSISDFKDKPFCHSFGAPIKNEANFVNVLNEIITDKKKEGREFFTSNNACMTRKKSLCRGSCRRQLFIAMSIV